MNKFDHRGITESKFMPCGNSFLLDCILQPVGFDVNFVSIVAIKAGRRAKKYRVMLAKLYGSQQRARRMVCRPVRWLLTNLWLSFIVSSYKQFVRHSVRDNSRLNSITSGMMPNCAGVEKFFTHMTFKAFGAAGHSCRKQFSPRQILNAKAPEPGGGSSVEQSDYED